MITLVGCNKGGASKTTTATNLAVALAMRGHDVCLVDADPQRTAAKWHAEREASGLNPAITLIEKRDNITSTLKSLDEKFDHVIVDVAGRNCKELITGALAAHVLIAPHQCSQPDLDTIEELQEQINRVRDLNPDLKALVYHSMASTNAAVRDKERADFLDYLSEFPELTVLNSVGFSRKIYKDAISEGRSVLETKNADAATEITLLVTEVYGGN